MDEGETDALGAPPPLGGVTAEADLTPPNPNEPAESDDFTTFIGPNADKFAPLFAPGGTRRRWRRAPFWPGFFFPLAWFMYRKMYGWAAFACALPIFVGLVNLGAFQRVLMSAPTLAGLAGRSLYAVQARRTIARIRAGNPGRPEEEVRQLIASAGGVSNAGAIVGGAIMFCASVIALIAVFKAHRP